MVRLNNRSPGLGTSSEAAAPASAGQTEAPSPEAPAASPGSADPTVTEATGASGVANGGEQEYQGLAREIGKKRNADVILFSGEIDHEGADRLSKIAKRPDRRANVFLLLTTRGGSPDAAFRIARCLQSHYEHLTVYIHGMCKSAGTLIAVGMNEVVLSDFGEFGPLDVQLGKKDELFENTSGLDITQALNSLNTRAYAYFQQSLLSIRRSTRAQISTKLAADIATDLAVGLYGPMFAQIDPVQLGAVERALLIAVEYGNRLAGNNLKRDAVERLATGYPSHGFVIDLREAETLFKNVHAPSETEERLGDSIEHVTRDETDQSLVFLLNAEAADADAAGVSA